MSTPEQFGILFEPVKIGPVVAPNRFYAVPHATGHGWHQPNGAIALRAMKAEGGWGTVAVQMCEISANSDLANHPMERIWDASDFERHQKQVDAIHQHGSLAAIELAHGGMRARNITTGLPVIGPSNLPILRPEIPIQARAMHKRDIQLFRDSHKQAALRAKQAGYDIIYVYAAHDLSILSHFLSLRTNQRTDEYGGSFTNRVRLLREVLQDTLEIANGEQAVAIRFSVAEPNSNPGLRHDGEGRDVVAALAELPDLWDVNISGWSEDSATSRFSEEGFQLSFTDFVKTVTSKPVVGVGRFTSPDFMRSVIAQGRLDLIGAARPSIADPFLPNKIRDGRIDTIRECIGCNICVSMDDYGVPIRCTQNPTISEEWRQGWHPETIAISSQSNNDKPSQQMHLIVGGGPAGLECAATLLRAGHNVTVAERTSKLGGRVLRESQLPGLQNWIRVRDHRVHQLNQHANARVYLESELCAKDIIEFDADTVTIATGASWCRDGTGSTRLANRLDSKHRFLRVLCPDDIMNWRCAPEILPPEQKNPVPTIVYDDEHFYMASVVAEALHELGHSVIYVTPLESIATWTDRTLELQRIIKRMNHLGIKLFPNTQLLNEGCFINTLDGAEAHFDQFDLAHSQLVIVGAREPNTRLYTSLQNESNLPFALYQAGDCLVPGIIQAAVLSGHQTAKKILSRGCPPTIAKREQSLIKDA